MDFGRVPEQELNDVAFVLSKDPEGNKKILEKAGKAVDPKIYIGCRSEGKYRES